MIEQISVRLVLITKNLIRGVAAMHEWQGERPCRPWHVKWLDARLADGTFHTPHWHFAELDGERYRVNGQHSSNMLLKTEHAIPPDMQALITEWRVKTENDLADLYCIFDHQKVTRSRIDMAGAHKATHEELATVASTVCNKITSGLAYALFDTKVPKGFSVEDRMALIHVYTDFVAWADEFMGRTWLKRMPIIAAMYTTYSSDAAEALKFWRLVRDEAATLKGHSTRMLADFLRDYTPKLGGRGHSRQLEPRAFYVKSLHAWNAYRQGLPTSLNYYPNAPLPRVR